MSIKLNIKCDGCPYEKVDSNVEPCKTCIDEEKFYKVEIEKTEEVTVTMGTKKDLKAIVKAAYDEAILKKESTFLISGDECTISCNIAGEKVYGVKLKFPKGLMILHSSVNTRKEMIRTFTEFLWKCVAESE